MPLPPPRNIEELLYRMLMESKTFHRFVQSVYNKVNGIPNSAANTQKFTTRTNYQLYVPTTWHKVNAFRQLFIEELKRSFGLKR